MILTSSLRSSKNKMNSEHSPRGFLRTTEEVINFIRIYKSYPCLWNIRSDEYKRNELKNRAFMEISDMYQAPVELVKRKIHSLRCTYNKELKKMRESKFKSNGELPIYQTSLIWFNEMNFLQDIITPRKTSEVDGSTFSGFVQKSPQFNSVDYNDSQDCQDSQEWQTPQDYQEVEDYKDVTPYSIEDSEVEPEQVSEENETYFGDIAPSRRLTVNTFGAQHHRYVDNVRYSPYKRSTNSGDEFDIFGASVTAQLREMDLCLAVETMAELQAVLSRKRIEDIHAKREMTYLGEKRSSSSEPQSSTAVM